MKRVLILIGVAQTGGGLAKLESIAGAFEDMKKWADEQKFDDVREFSDLDGKPVYLKDISECIEELDSSPRPPDQLVVYFNGHGVHNFKGDLWLLSKAPNQPAEAVDMMGSVYAAFMRSFKYVVLIMDACRVPPTDLQFVNVTGGSIFPNTLIEGDRKTVDQFFASTMGDPALEVNLNGVPSSIYTLQLTEFLRGMDPALLESMHAPDEFPKVVRPRTLRDALKTAVQARLMKNNINQITKPDAVVYSDPDVWLSTFDRNPPSSGKGISAAQGAQPSPPSGGGLTAVPPPPPPMAAPVAKNKPPKSSSRNQQHHAPGAGAEGILPTGSENDFSFDTGGHFTFDNGDNFSFKKGGDFTFDDGGDTGTPSAPKLPVELPAMSLIRKKPTVPIGLTRSAEFQAQITTALRPDMATMYTYQAASAWLPDDFHFETSCGFMLKGATAAGIRLNGSGGADSAYEGWVRVSIQEPRLALVTLEDGSGFLLPAIPGHIGFIEFEGDSIRNIAYEPSANYGEGYEKQQERYGRFHKKKDTLRDVRETFASAASSGDLRLAVLSDEEMREAMAVAAYSDEDVDLILLVLLGYSCAASGRQDNLRALCTACISRLGFLAFDLYLLAVAGPLRRDLPGDVQVMPPFPLAAQGWSMLSMAPASVREELAGLNELTFNSPWTLLKPEGVALCSRYVEEVMDAGVVMA